MKYKSSKTQNSLLKLAIFYIPLAPLQFLQGILTSLYLETLNRVLNTTEIHTNISCKQILYQEDATHFETNCNMKIRLTKRKIIYTCGQSQENGSSTNSQIQIIQTKNIICSHMTMTFFAVFIQIQDFATSRLHGMVLRHTWSQHDYRTCEMSGK